MNRWSRIRRIPAAVLFAASEVSFVVITDMLAHLGLARLAGYLCKLAARFNRDSALLQLAWVRSHAGDLEGALHLLEAAIPSEDHIFFRELQSGLMCQRHRQNRRAAAFFQRALLVPTPMPVSPEWRSYMERHVQRLKELADGLALDNNEMQLTSGAAGRAPRALH